MNRQIFATVSVVVLALGLSNAQTVVTFEAPGAGTGAGQGTLAEGVNAAGTIYGYYTDASGVVHGFLRASHGPFTTFSAPGAGTGSGQGTFAISLNPAGTLAGYYIDGSGVSHGYSR